MTAILRSSTLVLSLLITSCSGVTSSNDGLGRPTLLESDPTSTDELSGGGGASILPVEPAELPGLSDLALVVVIEDVLPSMPNTPSGLLPTILEGHTVADLAALRPITPVVVRVDEVLGVRPASEVRPEVGSLLTIHVPGGVLMMSMSFEQVRSLGMDIPPEDLPERPGDPIQIDIAIAPSVSLTEGERVILFLVRYPMSAASDEDMRVTAGVIETLQLVHGPYGMFPLGPTGAVSDDVRRLAESLEALEGAPIRR